MEILTFLKLFGISFLTLLGLDSLWLIKIAPKLYKDNIGHLMAENPNLIAAGLFYIVYIAGAVYFVIYPSFNANSAISALGKGALLGFVSYATFDLTSHAVFKNWPTKITVIDMAWGTVLTASVCFASTYIALKIVK